MLATENLLRYTCAKNCQKNRACSDKVITKLKWHSFFAHMLVSEMTHYVSNETWNTQANLTYLCRSTCWRMEAWRCSVAIRRTTPTSIPTSCDACRRWWMACSSRWRRPWLTARRWHGIDSRAVYCRSRNLANVNARCLLPCEPPLSSVTLHYIRKLFIVA